MEWNIKTNVLFDKESGQIFAFVKPNKDNENVHELYHFTSDEGASFLGFFTTPEAAMNYYSEGK